MNYLVIFFMMFVQSNFIKFLIFLIKYFSFFKIIIQTLLYYIFEKFFIIAKFIILNFSIKMNHFYFILLCHLKVFPHKILKKILILVNFHFNFRIFFDMIPLKHLHNHFLPLNFNYFINYFYIIQNLF